MEKNEDTLGKKVFFLYPTVFIQNQLIAELAQDEFEVYTAKDADKLRRVLKKYPNSVVFININEGMKENLWESWIRGIQKDSATSGVELGIVASSADENLKKKFLEQFKINCGYTVLKAELASAVKQVSDILASVNAKGRRKYIRLMMEKGMNATVNLPLNGTFVNGTIRDISVVGCSCSFADDPSLVKNSLFGDMQIRLQTNLLKAEGIVFGSREEAGEKIYVILFTPRTSPDVKVRMRRFIQGSLQARMDSELK